MGTETEKKGLNISVKSFVAAILIIFALMVLTYVLTFIIPAGSYDRVLDANGNLIIDTAGGFHYTEGGIPFWKWLLSPILVLTADGSATIIAVIVFLLVIGGVFNSLGCCGLMNYMLDRIVDRFGAVRYRLMAVIILFFMAMGSLVGSFEEVVPMAPIVVSMAVALGWDSVTGLAMSLLAAGCGFAAGVANPFTVGVAQQLAGLPMFSGMWLRFLSFVLIYALLYVFLRKHAEGIERQNSISMQGGHKTGGAQGDSVIGKDFHADPKMDRALKAFALILGAGILLVVSSAVLTFLQDYTMIIVALMFLIAGITAVRLSGMSGRELGRTFREGLVTIAPSIIMILMASSIKYTLTESGILDTALHAAVTAAQGMPNAAVILFIYLICLVMNFFIPSGSAKAFLLIPLIAPMAQIFGLSTQLCVVAYAFGDGFSNVFYPTNPALLICLGLAGIDYGKWARFSVKFQLLNLVLTSGILLLGLAVGY